MNKKLFLIAVVLGAFGTMGCLSPILTHAESKNAAQPATTRDSKSLADCDVTFKTQGLCASMDWINYPKEGELGAFKLRFWQAGKGNANGPYFEPNLPVFVRLWMPSMGHGSSPVTLTPALDSNGLVMPGVYDVTQVYFVMRGNWEIQIQLKDAEKSKIVEQTSFLLRY